MAELAFPDPPLFDEVVRLRPWSPADVDAAHAATRDPLIPRYTRVPLLVSRRRHPLSNASSRCVVRAARA
jgi:hypothetical protein